MIELKPCPFCGGTNIQAYEGSTHRWGYLACGDCGGNRGDCRKVDFSLPAGNAINIAGFADDWNARAPIVQDLVSSRRILPHPGSLLASEMLDTLLAEYNYPANPKNAARSGWEAANRWLLKSVHLTESTSDAVLSIETKAREIYGGWSDMPNWVPWIENGNSNRQDDARRIASLGVKAKSND